MAGEDLGSAKLVLTADDKDLRDKLRAAKQQIDELARQAGVTGDAFSKFFSRNYRLSINDSQLVAANTRLSNLQAKLKEIAASPINVRLNIIEGGLGAGGKNITRETIQRRFQEAARGGLSGQLTDILAGGVGASRTADLRSTLQARLGRGSLGSGGFNVPGLREVITQLGGAPSGAREQLLKQARELVQTVNDAVINKVGQDLLDLRMMFSGGPPPAGGSAPSGGGGPRDPQLAAERAQTRLIGLQTRLNALQLRGVDITRQRSLLERALTALGENNFRTTALVTQRLENATKLEEGRLRTAGLRQQLDQRQQRESQQAERQAGRSGGLGFATSPEQILAGRGGQQRGAAQGINANTAALDKQLGLINRINVLEAKGVNVASARAAITRAQAATSAGELGTANQILSALRRQVSTEENALRVAALRAAQAKKTAATTTTPGAPTPPPAPRGGLTPAQLRNRDIASNALIGGAFPLLFGQGIGASLGGAAGGAGGGAIGGQFGFGLSLVGTAVGAQFDAIIQKAAVLGKALNDPVAAFDELRQAGLLSSRGLERQVEGLIAVGANATAAAAIQRDLAASYGGAEAAKRLVAEQDRLNRSWTAFSVNLGQLALTPIADAATDATSTLRGLNEVLRLLARIPLPGDPTGGAGRVVGGILNPAAGILGGLGAAARFLFPPSAAARESEAKAVDDAKNALVRVQRIENQRLATQGKQLGSLAAQAQGYGAIAASLEKDVKLEKNRADIADAERRFGEVQGRADDPKVLAEKAKIQNEINNLVNEGVRIQQAYAEAQKAAATNSARQLALTKELVQVNPEERGFVQQRFNIRELQRQLGVTRAAAAANPADTGLQDAATALENKLLQEQLTLQDQLLRFQRERAAASQLSVANYKLEAAALDRQFAAAKRIAAVPTGEGITTARDTTRLAEGLREQVAAARQREAGIAAQIQAEQLRGGDGSEQRILDLQLQQVNAARETRNIIADAATQLRDAGQQLARDLRTSIVNFTAVRSDPQGLNRFLSPQDQSRRAQEDFQLLLPQFRLAQDRFRQLTGAPAREFSGPTASVNESIRDFINRVNAESSASESVIQTTQALIIANGELATSNFQLATATSALAQKDWNVKVFVDGTQQPAPLPGGGLP